MLAEFSADFIFPSDVTGNRRFLHRFLHLGIQLREASEEQFSPNPAQLNRGKRTYILLI
jgi:hypothetical protein